MAYADAERKRESDRVYRAANRDRIRERERRAYIARLYQFMPPDWQDAYYWHLRIRWLLSKRGRHLIGRGMDDPGAKPECKLVTVADLRDEFRRLYCELHAGTMDRDLVAVLNDTAGLILAVTELQATYRQMRDEMLEMPTNPFLITRRIEPRVPKMRRAKTTATNR